MEDGDGNGGAHICLTHKAHEPLQLWRYGGARGGRLQFATPRTDGCQLMTHLASQGLRQRALVCVSI